MSENTNLVGSAPGPLSTASDENPYGTLITPLKTTDAERRGRPHTLHKLDTATAPWLQKYMQSGVDGLRVPRVLHLTSPMLWVIDENAEIWFGVEEVVSDDDLSYLYPLPRNFDPPRGCSKLGHPALIGGAHGRIGGELSYDDLTERWTITNKSGRYGLRPNRTAAQLRSASELFASYGIDVSYIFTPPKEAQS